MSAQVLLVILHSKISVEMDGIGPNTTMNSKYQTVNSLQLTARNLRNHDLFRECSRQKRSAVKALPRSAVVGPCETKTDGVSTDGPRLSQTLHVLAPDFTGHHLTLSSLQKRRRVGGCWYGIHAPLTRPLFNHPPSV